MKRIHLLLSAAAASLALTGSAIVSPPVEIRPGLYSMHSLGGAYHTKGGLTQDLYKDAAAFCEEKGLKLKLVRADGSRGSMSVTPPTPSVNGADGFAACFASAMPSVSVGGYPEAMIYFRCVRPFRKTLQISHLKGAPQKELGHRHLFALRSPSVERVHGQLQVFRNAHAAYGDSVSPCPGRSPQRLSVVAGIVAPPPLRDLERILPR